MANQQLSVTERQKCRLCLHIKQNPSIQCVKIDGEFSWDTDTKGDGQTHNSERCI